MTVGITLSREDVSDESGMYESKREKERVGRIPAETKLVSKQQRSSSFHF